MVEMAKGGAVPSTCFLSEAMFSPLPRDLSLQFLKLMRSITEDESKEQRGATDP